MTKGKKESRAHEGRDGNDPLVRLLRDYAWRHRWSYAGGGLCLILTNWLAATIPGQLGRAVDAMSGDLGAAGRHILAIAAMGVTMVGVRMLSRALVFNPARHVEHRLRRDLLARLLRLQPSFYAKHRRGDLVSRATNDLGPVRAMVGYAALQVLNVGVGVALVGTKMVLLSPALTLLVALPVVLGVVVMQRSVSRLFELAKTNQEQLGAISEHVLGSLQGMATIQGFVAEQAFVRRFQERNRGWLQTEMSLALIRSLGLPLLTLSTGVAMAVLLGAGGSMVTSGALTVGQLVAFTALVGILVHPLRSLGWMVAVIERGRAALARVFELIDAPVERPEGPRGLVLQAGRGPRLELRHLHFAYPDDPHRPVLRDVSAIVEAGAFVGLFGRTGSGKSTLLRVLARLYNPPSGAVMVDGHDLNSLDLDAWRRQLAVVPQRPFLFSDSVAANVALSESADDERVREVVSLAALDEDLEVLPDGLATMVGERGIMLSGGQRQRLALARGLYREADLLLLDDVLAAVDHATEVELVEAITALRQRPGAPTVVLASLRLSALRHTDQILVLDRGRLVDVGRHEELLSRPGPYRDAWLAQRRERPAEAAS